MTVHRKKAQLEITENLSIGSGSFGVVYKAVMNGVTVAAKSLKDAENWTKEKEILRYHKCDVSALWLVINANERNM